jgi:hypothetical protein
MPPINRLTSEEQRRNRARDDQWEVSAHHRRRVTERILALAGPGNGRLCVLGAGNSNDLDVAALVARFREVHLVDIDGEALKRGLARQPLEQPRRGGQAAVHLHCVDLSSVWDSLDSLAGRQPQSDESLDELIARAANPDPPELGGEFDVVVSVGLISQLIDGVVRAAPATFPSFMELLLSVRSGHLRLLARLTVPGGHGLLITDFVSSATAPELAATTDAQLPQVAERLAASGNFFHGLNPVFLPELFRTDPILRSLVAEVTHCGYWVWDQRVRHYGVLAIEFKRTRAAQTRPAR